MANQDIELMAHLMRRAGFGATYEEVERRAANGYEATVDELLSPLEQPDLDRHLLERYFVDWKEMNALEVNQAYLTYRMINTQRPLQEKMTLFWHGIFCTGNSKCEHGPPDPGAVGHVSARWAWAACATCCWNCPGTRPWSSTWTTA